MDATQELAKFASAENVFYRTLKNQHRKKMKVGPDNEDLTFFA